MQKFTQYLRDTRAEMKQVRWPTQYQTFVYAALVIAISAVVAAFLGAFDYVFSQGIQIILNSLY